MRIAMIGQKGMPAHFGGVEKHVHDLSVRLAQGGVAVTVYARDWYTDPSITSYDGVRIQHIKTVKSKHFDTIIHTFLSTIHAIRNSYDVVHYHGVGPALLSWMVRIFSPKTRVITTFHCIDRKHAKWGVLARFFLLMGEWSACRFAHTTIAVSKTIQQYARDVYDCQTVYIPNAVTVSKKTTKKDSISSFGLTSGRYLIMVSRLIPHKGAHYLLDAWKTLSQQDPKGLGDMKLVIVGDGHHTDAYVQALHAQAQGNDRIVFTGFQSGEALQQLYSHARAMVHPSDNEGLPIVVLEAMSYGLPVLVSDIPEHRHLVQNYKYLFQAGSVSSLTNALQRLVEEKKYLLQEEGKRNKQLVIDEYQWDRILPIIMEVYTETKTQSVAVSMQSATL